MIEQGLKSFRRATGFASRTIRNRYKKAYQRLNYHALSAKPLFIVGCQRSGTNMVTKVLDKSPLVTLYNEDNETAFCNFRIRSEQTIRQLVDEANCQWVVFKPLCDSQHIDTFLRTHQDAKALWIFRDYRDSTNSAAKHWGRGQIALIRNLATREDWDHWLVERLPGERRDAMKKLYDERISPHTAAAIKWYLRNEIFFDNQLENQTERVLLCRYESLVQEPDLYLAQLFRFLDLPLESSYYQHVYKSSVGKRQFPDIDRTVQELCNSMLERLEYAFAENQRVHTIVRNRPFLSASAITPISSAKSSRAS